MEYADIADIFEQDALAEGEGLFTEEAAGAAPAAEAPAGGPADGAPAEPGAGDGPQGNQAAEREPAPDDGWRLTIRHNHQDIELTRQEAVTLAQKGRNYDAVAGERDRLRQQAEQAAPFLAELSAWAGESGMSLGDYMAYARKQRDQAAMEREVAQILAAHPETPEPLARELAIARLGERGKEAEAADQARQQRERAAELAPWRAFVAAYPDVKRVEDLPQAVFAAIEGGMEPLAAMQKHELEQARQRIAALERENQAYKNNQRNQKKALPSAQGEDGGAEADPFEQGLFE